MENIITVTVEPVSHFDWSRFDAITEDELEAMIDDDPDDNELTEEDWKNGKTDAEFVPAFTSLKNLKR